MEVFCLKEIRKRILEYYNDFWSKEKKIELSCWHYSGLKGLIEGNSLRGIILDVGCGAGKFLQKIGLESITKVGIDISIEGLRRASTHVDGNYVLATVENMPFRNSVFDIITLFEVIEHVNDLSKAIGRITSSLKHEGLLLISFPNYCNLPWLIVRILADLFRRERWIVRQPIDRILFFPQVISILKPNGYSLQKAIGTTYLPPGLWHLIKDRRTDRRVDLILDKLKLASLSFHPVLFFELNKKTKRPSFSRSSKLC